jgi:hypothetical protein
MIDCIQQDVSNILCSYSFLFFSPCLLSSPALFTELNLYFLFACTRQVRILFFLFFLSEE